MQQHSWTQTQRSKIGQAGSPLWCTDLRGMYNRKLLLRRGALAPPTQHCHQASQRQHDALALPMPASCSRLPARTCASLLLLQYCLGCRWRRQAGKDQIWSAPSQRKKGVVPMQYAIRPLKLKIITRSPPFLSRHCSSRERSARASARSLSG